MKALRTLTLAGILVLALPAAAATARDDRAEQLVEAINAVRADHGLAPLRAAPKLAGGASRHARHVIRTDDFSHGNSFRRAGFRTAGEAMAYKRGRSTKPRPAIRMWLRSPGHRALVLSRTFRYVGAGVARGNFQGGASTVWVAQFGSH